MTTDARQRRATAHWRRAFDAGQLWVGRTRLRPGYHNNNIERQIYRDKCSRRRATTTTSFVCNQEAGHCINKLSQAQFINQQHKRPTFALPQSQIDRARAQLFQQNQSRWCRTLLSPSATFTLLVLVVAMITNCTQGQQLQQAMMQHHHQQLPQSVWTPIVESTLPTMTSSHDQLSLPAVVSLKKRGDNVLSEAVDDLRPSGSNNQARLGDNLVAQSTQLIDSSSAQATDLAPFVELAGVGGSSQADLLAADSKKKKKMMKKKKKMEKKHKEWKKGKKHKKVSSFDLNMS